MFLRIRVADAVLVDGASFDNDISISMVRTLGELISRLTVEVVTATVLRATCIHLGRSIRRRAAEVEDTAE